MPVYNNAGYLKTAIDSILRQSFKDFECIIIDDGSTDNTAKIIRHYKDPRIKVIHHRHNKGLVFSLNQGIRHARGKYIIRMDGDDVSLTTRFKEQVAFMDDNHSIGVCASWIRVFGNGINYIWRTPIDHDDIKARSLFETPIAHPSVIMRRSVLIKNKLFYSKKFALAEDYELWTRASRVTKLHSYPKVLLKYRMHESQTGHTKITPQKQMGKKIRLLQLAKLHLHPNSNESKLHESICHWEKRAEFNQIRDWLNAIALANHTYQVYDVTALNNILIEKWFGLLSLYQTSRIKRLWLGLQHGRQLQLPSMRYALGKLGIWA